MIKKYKIQNKLFQIGGNVSTIMKNNLANYKRFLCENKRNILLEDKELDYDINDEHRRKNIECYYPPFGSIIQSLLYNIKYIKFSEFYSRLVELSNIVSNLKKPNDIYVLCFITPSHTIRQGTYNKSNIWCSHLVALNLINKIDYVICITQQNLYSNIRQMDMLKEAIGIDIGEITDKNIVFILADDCSYSGKQLNELDGKIHNIKTAYGFPHEYVILIPCVCKKSSLESIIKSYSASRFRIIYDKIKDYSSPIKSVSSIIEENKTNFEECKTIIHKLNDHTIEQSKSYWDTYSRNLLKKKLIPNQSIKISMDEYNQLLNLLTDRLKHFLQETETFFFWRV